MIDLPYKESLVAMIYIFDPAYHNIMFNPIVKQYGTYYGGFDDEWIWDKQKLLNATIDELETLYKILK